jgi:uncharacterized protein YfaA (DUF2138 family)
MQPPSTGQCELNVCDVLAHEFVEFFEGAAGLQWTVESLLVCPLLIPAKQRLSWLSQLSWLSCLGTLYAIITCRAKVEQCSKCGVCAANVVCVLRECLFQISSTG